MNIKFCIATLFMLFFSVVGIKAQSTVLSAGGSVSKSSSGSVAYSVGQPFATFPTADSKGSLLPGVQQVVVVGEVTGITHKKIDVKFSAYPNPTSDLLQLSVPLTDSDNYSFRLFDMNGRMLMNQRLSSSSTTLSLANYPQGMYLLKFFMDKSEVKTYKIIKK
jgi:hypothetical protein